MLLVVPAAVYTILQSAAVQTYIARSLASQLSEKLGTEVSIGKARINFMLDIVLEDIYIEDQKGQPILDAEKIRLDIGWPEIYKKIAVVEGIELKKARIKLARYEGENGMNFDFIAKYFSGEKKDSPRKKIMWVLKLQQLKLDQCDFSYDNFNRAPKAETAMDFNHLALQNISLSMDNIAMAGDSVGGIIHHLELTEKSGFRLNEFSARAIVSGRQLSATDVHILTPRSEISLDLNFSYNSFKSYNAFIDSVIIRGDIRPSRINFADIAAFSASMHGMNSTVNLSAEVRGRVSNMKVKKLLFQTGKASYFDGDLSFNGLPDIRETYVNCRIRNAEFRMNDITGFTLPLKDGKTNSIPLPEIMTRMGNLKISGQLTGFWNDFVAEADIVSPNGSIHTDLSLKNVSNPATATYKGNIVTENVFLNGLLATSGLPENISLNITVAGKGMTEETADLAVNGNISSLLYNGYNYSGINVNGRFSGKIFKGEVAVKDPNLEMHFDGQIDLTDSIPSFNFVTRIAYAGIGELKLLDNDSVSHLSGTFTLQLKGNTADNIKGSAFIDNCYFRESGKLYHLKKLSLNADIGKDSIRNFVLRSDFLDADINGFFTFAQIPSTFRKFVASYLPGIRPLRDSLIALQTRQKFDFDIRLYNAAPILKHLVPGLSLASDTRMKGNFNSVTNELVINASSRNIQYKNNALINWSLEGSTRENYIFLKSRSDKLQVTDSSWLTGPHFTAFISNDSIKSNLQWDNGKDTNRSKADIKAYCVFPDPSKVLIGFGNSLLIIDDTAWLIGSGGKILIDSSRAVFSNVSLRSEKQLLTINGTASAKADDYLSVQFDRFNLSSIDYLYNSQGFDLDGIASGNVKVSGLYGSPGYFADLKIGGFGFNNDYLGEANIKSSWDENVRAVRLDAEVQYVGPMGVISPIAIHGLYYPTGIPDNFDLSIDIRKFKLKSLQRYMSGIATISEGTADGKLKLKGSSTKPDLSGHISLTRAFFGIDYLNTMYSCTHDSIFVSTGAFRFSNMVVLSQPSGDTALCSGLITHNHFKDFNLDILLQPEKFLALNTTAAQNELFYGKAVASGNVRIFGQPEAIRMDIKAKTEKGTSLIIPVGGTSEMSESNYISFVNTSRMADSSLYTYDIRRSGMAMEMVFEVTDDAEVQIMFDPKVGDRIRGRGSGNLRMNVNTNGDFRMYGDYTIRSGDYLFTFENVINKHFTIQEGGILKWNGDPYEAEINLKAVYRLRASLAGLGIDSNRRTVPVECIINMTEKLSNPTFTFEINLPSLSEFEKSPYLAAINQNLNNNFISLLVINSFVRTGIGTGATAASAGNSNLLGKSSSEVLSNQLSNWLSQISKDVDIGINYRPGDAITSEEVEVALSTQLFNDRVSVESNVGVGGQNNQQQQANNIVGDVNVEVKLTDRLKLMVFNKSNQGDYINNNAPYTQGLGVSFRKEFNSFGDLFRSRKKRSAQK